MNAPKLTFRDFLIYRYARPERLHMRTPGDKMIRAALTVIADPDFPDEPDSLSAIVDHVFDSPLYKGRRSRCASALNKAFAEYKGWRLSLEEHLRLTQIAAGNPEAD